MMPSTTQAPSPSPRCHSWAHNTVVIPKHVMLCTSCHSWAHDAIDPHRHWAHNVIVLIEPVMPSTHAVPEPATPSSSLSPQHYIVYFSLSFWVCKSWFWYATLAHCFDMLHCFHMLYCHITLICYIAFVLVHCFEMPHCHIVLICYIAFVLLHYFDMLQCHIILICYTLLHYFCSATFWSIWMQTTLLNDESWLSETSVATWTNIIVLFRFQHWTTWSR
jgi:hypothetical protein